MNTLAVDIAGLGVELHCAEPKIVSALHRRYRDFPGSDENRIQLQVQIEGTLREHAMLDTGMVFKNGDLFFEAPGYSGWIREREGLGKLLVSSRQPAEEIEYFLRVAYALLAFQAGGVMLHTAGMVRNGQAYLFFGHSGSGKTTACRVSTGCTVLNDDLVVLLPTDSGWRVSGTPFWNPTQVKPSAETAPLHSLYRLVQNKSVFLEKISTSAALAELVSNVPVIPADPIRSIPLLSRLQKILQDAPVHKLHFLPDNSFWNVIPA